MEANLLFAMALSVAFAVCRIITAPIVSTVGAPAGGLGYRSVFLMRRVFIASFAVFLEQRNQIGLAKQRSQRRTFEMRSISSSRAIVSSGRLFGAGLLFGSFSFFTGCASVVRGGSEKLIIQSTPAGAEVKLSTGQSGVTPYEVEVKRKETIFLTITKSGYKELNTAVISSIDGASLGIGTAANILFLPVINDIVDYKTGANYSHKPNPLLATLIPAESTATYQLAPPPAAPAATAPVMGAQAPTAPPKAEKKPEA